MLIGQRKAEALLARAIHGGRVGHAYLFLGPSGSGKDTAARLFASAMNCERQPAARREEDAGREWRLAPCGECASCRRIAAGTHPEVIEVRPGSQKGQNIDVKQAREIRLNAALRPKMGARRVYLIPKAETFSEDSANTLLKTLEEPSDFVTMILCAPSPSHVLPTVRSRCQMVRFGLASPDEVTRALTSRGTTPEIARLLALACGGRPGLALSWAGSPAVLKRRREVLDLFARAVGLQGEAQADPSAGALSLRLAEEFVPLARGEEPDDAPARPAKVLHGENLSTGLTYLRDLLLIASGGDPSGAQNQDRLDEIARQAALTRPARVLADMEAVREARQLLDRNVQPQLVLERMFWTLIAGAESV